MQNGLLRHLPTSLAAHNLITINGCTSNPQDAAHQIHIFNLCLPGGILLLAEVLGPQVPEAARDRRVLIYQGLGPEKRPQMVLVLSVVAREGKQRKSQRSPKQQIKLTTITSVVSYRIQKKGDKLIFL